MHIPIRSVGAAAMLLTAAPAFAQSAREVIGPWTLTPNLVLCTDVAVATRPMPRSVIKGAYHQDPRLASATGAQLLIPRAPDDGLAPGRRYITARLNGALRDFPRRGEGVSGLRITGVITVTAVDEVNAIADVDLACDSIEPGDFLEPFTETLLPGAAQAVVAPDFSDRARLLFGLDHRTLVGHGAVISIDRGTLHGVVPGARYAIYRDRRDGSPLIYMGEAVVMTTGEESSKVVITKSIDGLETGDVAVPRRRQ
jgi:hypothetical protein